MFDWQLKPRAEGDAASRVAHVARGRRVSGVGGEGGLFPGVVVVQFLLRSSRMRIAVVIGNRLIDF